MPLYYSEDCLVVSDDVDELIKVNDIYKELSAERLFELYASSYVGFNNTVYKNVKQLQMACTAQIKNGMITEKPYYIHCEKVNHELSESEALEILKSKTDKMIDRITATVNGRQIVLSLSGGYDSRYIACSLKDKGIENVVCYTYGKYDSFEVAQSKKVAEALNYSWYNVQYDEKDIRKLIHENEYFDYANRPDYSVYLQNFLAVKYLHDNKIIADDAVCITGLCNDMPTGSYIPSVESLHGKYDFSNLGFSYYELDRNFQIFSISEEAKDLYIKDVLTFLDFMKINVTNYQEFVSALDCFETSMIHSRCYLNANTVHEFFGYEWLLPCWDRELLSFWYELPIEFRYKQHLYEVYITEHLASKYGVGTKKHLVNHAATPFRRKIKRKIGGILDKILYPLGIPIRRKTDINNFAGLEVDLYKNISQKKSIKKADRAALILLLTIYIMERRYGTNWYDTIKKYLE